MKTLRTFLLTALTILAFTGTASAHYDPNIGRWLSRDPIGEVGGTNLYGFVGNEPLLFIDILGYVPFAVYSVGNKEPGDDNAFQDRAQKGVGEISSKPYVSGQDLLEVCKGLKHITRLDVHAHGNRNGIGAGGIGNGMYRFDYGKPGVTATLKEFADAIKNGEIDVEKGAEIRLFSCQCSEFARELSEALKDSRPDINITGSTSNVAPNRKQNPTAGKADAEKDENGQYKFEKGRPVQGHFNTYQGGKAVGSAPSIPYKP